MGEQSEPARAPARLEVSLLVDQLSRRVPGGIGTYAMGLLQGFSELRDSSVRVHLHGASRVPRIRDLLWDWGVVRMDSVAKGSRILHATSMAFPWRGAMQAALRVGSGGSSQGPLAFSVMVHDVAWRQLPEAFPRRGRAFHDRALARALGFARSGWGRIVVPSNATAKALVEGGLDLSELESSVVVIPHGSDHLPRGDLQGSSELLAKVGLMRPFLLAVGTLEPRKNLPRLIEAYRLAREEAEGDFPDLAIVGPRGWGDSPGRILEERGASRNTRQAGVYWLGKVPPRVMAALYETAVGLVYVPLLEGFGLPVFEAMAKDLPVVASPVPALEEAEAMMGSEASGHGKLARVVDPRGTEDIAAGIVQLVFDETLRRELVDSSRAVVSKATWARSARSHKELWEQLTSRVPSGTQKAAQKLVRQPAADSTIGRGSPLGGRSKEPGNDTRWRGSAGTIKVTLDVTAVPVESVGVGRYLEGLTGGLCKLGSLELVLIARKGDRDRWVRWAPCAQVLDIAPKGRLTRLFWQHLWEGRVLSRIRPDVHHGPHYFAPRVPGLPSVVTIHDMTFIEHPEWHEGPKAHLFAWEIKRTVRQADVILSVSNFSACRLRALAPPRGELRVVHHGVDAGLFSPDEPSEGFDAKVLLRLGVRQPYVLFVGTIEPRKGVPDLIEAFCKLLGSPGCPQGLKLVLVGSEGWGIAEVRSTIEKLGCQKDVIMTGWVEDQTVAALLRRANVVAYPSLEEGFGLPALEALACGATLVTTRGSAVEEVVGEMAYLVDPGDVSGLAEALGEALGVTPVGGSATPVGVTAGAAGAAAGLPTREERVQYAQRFTWDACAAEHLDAYYTAVALASRARGKKALRRLRAWTVGS